MRVVARRRARECGHRLRIAADDVARRVGRATALVLAVVLCATSTAATPVAAGDEIAERAGIVQRYLVNEFGEVDGILDGDEAAVRFPPHMGEDLVATLKPGDRFVARGRPVPGGGFQAYSLGKEGSVPLIESRPRAGPPPTRPHDVGRTPLVTMTVAGTIAAIVRGPGGETEGVVIDDGTNIRLPPRNRVTMSANLRVGTAVRALGYGTRNRYGCGLRAEQFGVGREPLVSLQPEGPTAPPKPPPPPDRGRAPT